MILNLKEYKIQINCKLVSEVDFILLTDCTIHNILKLPLVLKLPNIPIIYGNSVCIFNDPHSYNANHKYGKTLPEGIYIISQESTRI